MKDVQRAQRGQFFSGGKGGGRREHGRDYLPALVTAIGPEVSPEVSNLITSPNSKVNSIQRAGPGRFRWTGGVTKMKNRTRCDTERASEATAEMHRYFEEHPGSPSAIRQPRITIRGATCVALLGGTISDGIAGFGDSVAAALAAFDRQYLNYLRPAAPRRVSSLVRGV